MITFGTHWYSSSTTSNYKEIHYKYNNGNYYDGSSDDKIKNHHVVGLMDVVKKDTFSNPWIFAVTHSAKRSAPLVKDWYVLRVQLNGALTEVVDHSFR